jgi:hypothetical protein
MIRYKIFYGESTPTLLKGGHKVVGEMIHSAHQKAEAWLAENPQVEVVSISNGYGNTVSGFGAIFVSVWYRKPS